MGIRESREKVKEALVRFVEAVEAADKERDEAEKAAEELRGRARELPPGVSRRQLPR